jgi:C1A family cysteine protease
MSDAHATARATTFESLSPEYLFYHGIQRSTHKDPKRGLTLDAAVDALRVEGQPHEAGWPYAPSLPTDLSAWVPPSNLTVYRATADQKAISAKTLRDLIDSEKIPFAVIRTSNSFFKPSNEGLVEHKPGDQDRGLHGVTIVGHGEAGASSVYLVRNSWGRHWGLDGHAWTTEQYLISRIRNLAIVN